MSKEDMLSDRWENFLAPHGDQMEKLSSISLMIEMTCLKMPQRQKQKLRIKGWRQFIVASVLRFRNAAFIVTSRSQMRLTFCTQGLNFWTRLKIQALQFSEKVCSHYFSSQGGVKFLICVMWKHLFLLNFDSTSTIYSLITRNSFSIITIAIITVIIILLLIIIIIIINSPATIILGHSMGALTIFNPFSTITVLTGWGQFACTVLHLKIPQHRPKDTSTFSMTNHPKSPAAKTAGGRCHWKL
ncbi:hypothetical protein P5673_003694 [Acropora cervicornis]|uniref:Uncharacterized protein n=1 Tax=Acropora cervicornis TaxID=6130 RepID=A0AAD9R1J5_ACRCE|nr:hypothetical protein P5673_003694 [Acropora cervicornis]